MAEMPDSVQPAPNVVLDELTGGGALAVNTETGAQITLDQVAAKMWSVLASTATTKSAADQLASTYDVDMDTLTRDLVDLIETLAEAGFLQVGRA